MTNLDAPTELVSKLVLISWECSCALINIIGHVGTCDYI